MGREIGINMAKSSRLNGYGSSMRGREGERECDSL
jgi:hypothetical protein